MTSTPILTVHKQAYYVPTSVIGTDEQGRTLVACPFCGDEAYVEADGRVVCSGWAAVQTYLQAAVDWAATQFEREFERECAT